MVDYDELSDDELTTLLKTGEESAFEEIYNRYWDKMFYMAHRIVKSSEIAEEITQDVFLLLWAKRETLNIVSLKQYLAAMLRYEVYRSLAKMKKEEVYENEIRNTSTPFVSIEKDIENKLLLEIITTLTNRLSEKCRLVFQYNKLEDRSLSDICEELQISPKTAEAHLTKALKVVRASLSGSVNFILQIMVLTQF
ncbi:RNA polymerase sigma factor [Dyadobacter frigoris]|uniref:Sigma-70 family RNA polymerase sigma factor n=1 Tax=Dyadobacter frigoris TaxID=2576211 RepID=A0A4U6D2H9_9BACT|nr:sigma-70 family RNA polymerase sigma factor [Dyadobacter frigoris]TKT90271.1 sigma-70 family RNA polymerase sigma factor [Dyadobacter frigoris]GLU52506.1 RNA polymerase sigma-70 factor [Dyadobacter frigoris]